MAFIELPPLLNTYTTNYTTIRDLLASPLTATPTQVRYFPTFTPPVVYNWSLGVQRDVRFGLVADVAYVGNASRKQLITQDINGRPYGYAYQASSLDPTNSIMIGNDHIGLAKGRDYADISPVAGLILSSRASRMSTCRSMSCRGCDLKVCSLGT